MSATIVHEQPPHPHVRAVTDGRPPCFTWSAAERPDPRQPPLLFDAVSPVDVGPPDPVGHRVHVVSQPWVSEASTALPDARSWSASLALALAETLQGQRPVGQLSRWVDERVLATLTVAVRSRRSPYGRSTPAVAHRPAVLRSIHLQSPRTGVVEASAHVQLSGRSTALALRLEAWYDRWLCTALELGPRDQKL